jgi:Na+/melibiose symporter-like transporter
MEKDLYRTSRVMYILEAAFEYFISILVGGAYLAKLTTTLGLSDSITGILSSLAALGCSLQILAVFFWGKKRVKRSVTVLHSLNQLCFTLIYVVPLVTIPKAAKIAVFVALLLSGRIINNLVQSPKINWFMSLVDDRKRGRFTANKEIISLIGGMIFSFAMGNVMDHFEEKGDVTGAFIVCGITLFILTLLHTATLFLSREKEPPSTNTVSKKELLSELIRDTSFIKIILVSVLWNIAHCVTTPFLGVYQIKELGFSMVYVSILSEGYAICRSIFSRPLGKYADKHSFAKMLNICFAAAMLAFTVNIFTVPSNGKVFYAIYYMLYAIGMAGINSGGINLIYERVSREKRVCALALKNSIAGTAGFLTTLLAGTLIDKIQADGNRFLGLNVYAQQVASAISAILILGIIVYLNTVVKKISIVKNED